MALTTLYKSPSIYGQAERREDANTQLATGHRPRIRDKVNPNNKKDNVNVTVTINIPHVIEVDGVKTIRDITNVRVSFNVLQNAPASDINADRDYVLKHLTAEWNRLWSAVLPS